MLQVLKLYAWNFYIAQQPTCGNHLARKKELVDVDFNAIKSPEYLHLQPFGQMPCIVRE
jgi:hypothetical protein